MRILDSAVPGMDIIVTKRIAMEGTALLVREKKSELLTRFSGRFLSGIEKWESRLSVQKERKIAASLGVPAVYEASEGGIYGALWEFGKTLKIGMEIELKKIPIYQETVEICEFFGLHPYRLLSGGTVLMAAENGASLVCTLENENVPAAVIGRVTAGNDRVLLCEDERRYLERSGPDEIDKILYRRNGLDA